MSYDLAFTAPETLAEGDAAHVPGNYLQAALAAILDQNRSQSRILLMMPEPARNLGPRYAVIGADSLRDPHLTADFIRSLNLGPAADSTRQMSFLGPPLSGQATGLPAGTPAVQEITAQPWQADSARPFRAAVVIIDAGLAFWNQRFRSPQGPRFREIRFLDFQQAAAGLNVNHGLKAADIAALCSLADTSGTGAVMSWLGGKYPNSFYGPDWNQQASGLWHGTAVADLAAGAGPDEPDDVAMFGIELPMTVLRDADGDSLTAVMAVALHAAIKMSAAFADLPVVIVLPYGFSAGPQDGSHPAAAVIGDVLQAASGQDITLVVPAGNHLQDRCRAILPPSPPGGPAPQVDWHIAPDDFSVNAVEILIANAVSNAARATITIQPPNAATKTAPMLSAHQFVYLTIDGVVVGMLMRFANSGTTARLRLVLAPTGQAGAANRPAPHGTWTLSRNEPDLADLWVLRDDRDPVLDGPFPRRASWLEDPLYQDLDRNGAPRMTDDPGSAVLRTGTLSVLATSPWALAVQADQKLGPGPQEQAWYSGLPQLGRMLTTSVLVDDGWPDCGVAVAANGTAQRLRMSGTSAAVGLYARKLLGLPPAPPL